MLMEMILHKLTIISVTLSILILVIIIGFIFSLQKNRRKLNEKINELDSLSELLKQKEFALQASQHANKKSEKYFSIISREVKKPFNSFANLSDVLMNEFDFLSNDEKIHYIKQLNEGINTSINKFQNIFHWINYKTGNYRFHQETVHVSECVLENIKEISKYALGKKIEFQTDIEPNLKTIVDRQMFDAILRNLLYNAMEASSMNSRIIIQAFNTAGTIKFSVQDFGTGVSEQIKSKIINSQTFRFSKEIETDYSSGVGLLLVKEFIQRNGGELWIDSENNQGSKFTFTTALYDAKSTN